MMDTLTTPRQPPLFDLPVPVWIERDAARWTRMPMTSSMQQRPLWISMDAYPSSGLSTAACEVRARLADFIDPDTKAMRQFRAAWRISGTPVVWDQRTHERGQQLLPLLRQVSYTQALVDGAFRVYLEYRPCDKTPHYRVLWGDLLWGRLNIRTDTNLNGADILTCHTLPLIQDRLADYLIALGYRIESARLWPHVVEDADDDDFDRIVRTVREYRLFSLDADPRRRMRRQLKKSQMKEGCS